MVPSDKVGALPAETPPAAEYPAPSLSSWPTALPGLGTRRVIAFTECRDCQMDPPADDVLTVGVYVVTIPGPTGTFVAYAGTPLCRRHACARAGDRGVT